MIDIGQALPRLTRDAYFPDGRIDSITLDACRGRWLVLFCWALDFTVASARVVRDYAALSRDFEVSGTTLLGASVDSAHAHQAWVKQDLGPVGFPMLGDVSRTLCQALGVLTASGCAANATVIADPEGRVISVTASGSCIGRSAHDSLCSLHALQSRDQTARDGLTRLSPLASI